MPKVVAFLRAINVGGHTVKMDYLRQLFGAMGFTNVETVIASGNVIFDAPATDIKLLEQQIEASLQAALGYRVATFIRTTSALAEIVRYKPFEASDLAAIEHTLYIAFIAQKPDDAATRKLQLLATEVDAFHIDGCEVYWLRRTEIGESQFSGALLEKTLAMEATVRNATTVRKIAAKYP